MFYTYHFISLWDFLWSYVSLWIFEKIVTCLRNYL